jgi:uncharacterized protein (DUF488 family)
VILSTIGYQGLSLEFFFRILIQNNIEVLIDIRELPLSHKTGFSKSALARKASTYDIRYIHLSSLGCPRDIRHDYRKDRNWDRYSNRFLAYLKTQSQDVDKLADLIQQENCCLLCFESNPNRCHRFFVAKEVAARIDRTVHVKHLGLREEKSAV